MARVPARGLADVADASTELKDTDGRTGRPGPIRPDSKYVGERSLRCVPLGVQ